MRIQRRCLADPNYKAFLWWNDMKQNNERIHGNPGSDRGRALRQRGQAILELVLVLPILLMLTLGVIEFGRAAYYDIAVCDAARAGAQYASQSLADSQDFNSIQAAALSNSQTDMGVAVTVNRPQYSCVCPGTGVAGGSCPTSGCTYPLVYVTVSTTYPLPPLFTYPGISSTFNLNGSTTLPVQRQ
jgi:Flp pilus assembly protein TadG